MAGDDDRDGEEPETVDFGPVWSAREMPPKPDGYGAPAVPQPCGGRERARPRVAQRGRWLERHGVPPSPSPLDEGLRETDTGGMTDIPARVLRRTLSTIACLMGAAGVIAAAVAAHVTGEARMASAAQILMIHAAASLALAGGAFASRFIAAAAAAMQAGAILFAADMTARTVASEALFPSAAPIGGTILIVAWLTAAAGFAFRRGSTGQ